MTDFDTTLSPSPPSLELVAYVWAEPGASTKAEQFSYFEILTMVLDGEEDVLIEATLVKSGALTCFEEDVTMCITRSIARDRIVSRAEAIDAPRTMVGSHVCASCTAPQCQSCQWFNGTISDYLWDEEAGMGAYHLPVDLEEEPTIIRRCPSIHWIPVDLFCFGLRPLNKNSTLLHSADQVRERHGHVSHCLQSADKSTHWDSAFATKQNKRVLDETYSVDGWAKIPFFNFQTCNLFWRSVNHCVDFAYYVLGNRTSTRAKAVPRPLMDQMPEDLRASTKRKIRTPSRTSSSRPFG
jgi:hypothetical protein